MTEPLSPPEQTPPKLDPESLVLRAAPARITRFRRGAVVLIAGIGATALAGVSWFALRPVGIGSIAIEDERGALAAKGPADALAGAPSSYGDVPRLGPALPGDLGRPILNRQRDMAMEPVDPATEAATKAAQEADAARQRIAAERKAARESGVMLQLAEGPSARGGAGAAAVGPDIGAASRAVPVPDGPARADASVGRAAADVDPHALVSPVSPWTLHAGSIIAASLITGLNSDLPGLVTAQVTENVYDSVTGRTLLVPQGSRLIGRYEDDIAFGQSRALVVWQRIILPDGSSIRIDDMPATDTQGYAGLADGIDRHSWQLLKGVALSTLLGVGAELGFGSHESDLVSALREAVQQNGARAGDQFVTRNLDIQPTLRVRPGWPLRVVVNKDLLLAPWTKARRP